MEQLDKDAVHTTLEEISELHSRIIELQILLDHLVTAAEYKYGTRQFKQLYQEYKKDHLRYGDRATMYDLQLLCADCHRTKTEVGHEAYLPRTPHCPTCTCYDHTQSTEP